MKESSSEVLKSQTSMAESETTEKEQQEIRP
jgi:hypothetical protein